MYTTHRPWRLLAVCSAMLQIGSLFFQYGAGWMPCVFCIYQRTSALGLLLASLFALHSRRRGRFVAALVSVWSAWRGWRFSMLPKAAQLIEQCPIKVDFPRWLPLDRLLPFYFEATGGCTKSYPYLEYATATIFLGCLLTSLCLACVELYESGYATRVHEGKDKI